MYTLDPARASGYTHHVVKKIDTPADDDTVPVIMHEVRTLRLQHYAHDADRAKYATARKSETAVLPGLNYVSRAVLQASGAGSSANIRLKSADPCALDAWQKEELIAQTASRSALERWRASEPDPAIRKALDARISSMRAGA